MKKEVYLTIDELRLQAEKLGFELVEKKRQVKIGDFGLKPTILIFKR